MTTMHIGNEGQGHATNIVGWPDGQLNAWWMSWNQTSMMVAFILCKEAIVLVLNDLKLIGKCVGYKLNAQLFVACCPTFYYSWAFLQAIFTWLYQASFLYYAFCFKLIWLIYMSLPEFPYFESLSFDLDYNCDLTTDYTCNLTTELCIYDCGFFPYLQPFVKWMSNVVVHAFEEHTGNDVPCCSCNE